MGAGREEEGAGCNTDLDTAFQGGHWEEMHAAATKPARPTKEPGFK